MWEALYRRLVTAEGLELVRPPAEAVDAALDSAEAELRVRFPAGYRTFIHRFGPGELGEYFRIYRPSIPGFPDYGNNILEENRNWRDPEGFWATTAPPELVARLVCFSTTIGGDACFWDPADVRSVGTGEYGIYALSRGSRDARVRAAAGSFEQFVERHRLGNDFVNVVGGQGWEGGGPAQSFLPAWRTRKARRS